MRPAALAIGCGALLLLAASGLGAAEYDPVSAWHAGTPDQPAALIVRGATVWTSAAAGRLDNADLLVRKGKIVAIGPRLQAPAGAQVIDGTGLHLTPGLIDAHSHTAIVGNVNEGSDISTAQVRISDVLNPDDVAIYRELAGGLTVANVLHGSANAIGGQNAVIKLRWGAPADGLLLAGAPPGIKFALGENPKQSNWNPRTPRFPHSRMGVEEIIRDRFQAARNYARRWADFRASKARNPVPPRRDLELEALLEVLSGKRLVHAHSYRGDEILMLIRLADTFGFRVATFQHALESYKVAAEMARHGAGASLFSDWWAYKYEVIDAIPWAGAIDWSRGVLVSFNSDSDELARHLNTEAGKAVRYGGVPEEEALKFVTANPAAQLGIADRVGTLETGKDADFVLWSDEPLSTSAVCLQTWIDGRKYFDRDRDLETREAVAAERQALLEKVRAEAAAEKAAQNPEPGASSAPANLPGDPR